MLPIPFIMTDSYQFLSRFTRETLPNMVIHGESGSGKKRLFLEWWGDTVFRMETEMLRHDSGSSTVEFQFQYDADSLWWNMQQYKDEDEIIFQQYIRNYMRTPHLENHRKFIIIDHAELLSEIVMRRIGTAIERWAGAICYIFFMTPETRLPQRLESRILHLRVPVPTMDLLDEVDVRMCRSGTDGIRWMLYQFYGYVPLHHYMYYLWSTDLTMDHDAIFAELMDTMRSGQLTGPVIDMVRDNFYILLGKLAISGSCTMFLLHWILRTGLEMATTDEIRYEIIDRMRLIVHPRIAGSRDILFLESAYWRVVRSLHQLS
jgi:hypothetical protein